MPRDESPKFAAPHNFQNLVIDEGVLIVVWGGDEVFPRGKGEICDAQVCGRKTRRQSCELHAAAAALHAH